MHAFQQPDAVSLNRICSKSYIASYLMIRGHHKLRTMTGILYDLSRSLHE